jgi:hypothetical protein
MAWTEIGITEHDLEVDHLRTIDDMFAILAEKILKH